MNKQLRALNPLFEGTTDDKGSGNSLSSNAKYKIEASSTAKLSIFGGVALIACLSGQYLLILVPLAIYLVPIYRRSAQHRKRVRSFETDYPALVVLIASMIRAGTDPIYALLESVNLFEGDSEMRRQLLQLSENIQSGKGEMQSLALFGEDYLPEELSLFRKVVGLSRSEGSNLGPALVRLAKVTRQRQSFRMKTRSSIALQRMSTLGLLGCALVTLGIQFSVNPESIQKAYANTGGRISLTIGVLLMMVGASWMLLLCGRKVGVA